MLTCSETRRGRIALRAIVGDQGASLQRKQDSSSVLRRVSSEAGSGGIRGCLPTEGRGLQRGSGGLGSGRPTAGEGAGVLKHE